jgi:hypothetical protein
MSENIKKVNVAEESEYLGEGRFIYRPEVTDKPSYRTLCGICHDELEYNISCSKLECIEEKSKIKQASMKPRCFNHGVYFEECFNNPECKAAQNLKDIIDRSKGE